MQTILGSNGIIGTELAKELYRNYTKEIRLVSRHPQKVQETDQLFPADLLDSLQTREAVEGSEIVYLTAGVPNNWKIAKAQWPVIMKNVLEACLVHKAKLVFFDNTYMYGTSDGLITEETPFLATGRKGKVRAKIANMVNHAIQNTEIIAMICRAPEFYGPRKTKSITNTLIFENIRQLKKPMVLLNDSTLRTLIYSPDAAKSMALLGNTPDAYHQTWHLPCDNNRLTAKEFIQFTSEIYGEKLDYLVLKNWMIRIISLFNPNMRETIELLYRYKTDNLFDSSKFKRRFPDYRITTYQEGISEIVEEIIETREMTSGNHPN